MAACHRCQLSRRKIGDARRAPDRVVAVIESFSDRTLAFDLEWSEIWLGDNAERSLRLGSLQARATEEGYLLQARRAERALAISSSSSVNERPGAPRLPILSYARVDEAPIL